MMLLGGVLLVIGVIIFAWGAAKRTPPKWPSPTAAS